MRSCKHLLLLLYISSRREIRPFFLGSMFVPAKFVSVSVNTKKKSLPVDIDIIHKPEQLVVE